MARITFILESEARGPLLNKVILSVVNGVMGLDSGTILVRLTLIILETVLELGVTFRHWVVLRMVDNASGRVKLSSGHSTEALFCRNIKKEIAIGT
jgi:hypothetical protein